MQIKFAHMADVHLGSWNNHPDLREMPLTAFDMAMDMCIAEGVNFILIAGDLFDTSLPSLDILKGAVCKMKDCLDAGIPIYVVPGSHDFSPSGKTMLSVLEEAGLLQDVSMKLVRDKSGVKIFGMPGKKGGLESHMYGDIDIGSLEKEDGFKIFMFHSAISEHCTVKQMATIPLSYLPKNFSYYATGHLHETADIDENGFRIVFPGSLYATTFDELERTAGSNGFFMVTADDKSIRLEWKEVKVCEVETISMVVDEKKPNDVESEILNRIEQLELSGKILLIKVTGVLDGKLSDIDFRVVLKRAYERGARVVKKSAKIETKELLIEAITPKGDIETDIIEMYIDKMKLDGISIDDEKELILNLMNALKDEKAEGETNATFEERLKVNTKKVIGL